jgi:hypothetical protein
VHFASTLRPRLAAAWPEAGARFTHQVLSPTSLRYEPVRVRVDGHETLDGVETLRIVEESQGMETRAWIDRQGRALKEEGGLGFTLKREPEAVAKSGVDRGQPGRSRRDDARPVRGHDRRPAGARPPGGPRDGRGRRSHPDAPPRQRVQGDVIRITREDKLPVATTAADDLDRWRAPSPFVESDDAGIVARAKAIVGNAAAPRRRCGECWRG